MNRRLLPTAVAAAVISAAAMNAQAQYVTFFPPAPALAPAPVTYRVAMPVTVAAPVTVAQPITVAMPVTVARPIAVAAPVWAAPAPTVTFFRPPVVSYVPTTRVVTRFRPILGGTVSRVQQGFVPVTW